MFRSSSILLIIALSCAPLCALAEAAPCPQTPQIVALKQIMDMTGSEQLSGCEIVTSAYVLEFVSVIGDMGGLKQYLVGDNRLFAVTTLADGTVTPQYGQAILAKDRPAVLVVAPRSELQKVSTTINSPPIRITGKLIAINASVASPGGFSSVAILATRLEPDAPVAVPPAQ